MYSALALCTLIAFLHTSLSAATSGILHSVGNAWIESSGDNICVDLAKIEKYAGGGWGERGGGGAGVPCRAGCHTDWLSQTLYLFNRK